MTPRVRSTACVTLAMGLMLAGAAIAQSQTLEIPQQITDQTRSGELPVNPRVTADIESLDLTSGTPSIRVPLIHVHGRGLQSNLILTYNANLFTVALRSQNGDEVPFWNGVSHSGWQENLHTNARLIQSVAVNTLTHKDVTRPIRQPSYT